MKEIKKVAVLGAGVMGQGIAAHLAGAGIPVYLLDIVPPQLTEADQKAGLTAEDPRFRDKFALNGLEAIKKSKPSVIYTQRDLKLITPGNFEDDWSKLAECDWIVEVVVEKIEIKRSVFEKIEQVRKADAIVSSNTSGIPLREMAEGRSEGFRKNFLVTHFFNPVRYLKLVEIVSSGETDPQVVKDMAGFLEEKLGKGVVYAKDTPNFIANRVGVFAAMLALKQAMEDKFSVEEVDKIFGPAMGKPRSAMFKTADLAGVDILAYTAKNNYEGCPNDEKRDVLATPDLVQKMLKNGWTGNKVGQGFYKKTKDEQGKKQTQVLDLETGEYRPAQEVKFDSLKAAKGIEDTRERVKFIVGSQDRAGEFAWKTTRDTLVYAANRIPEIADDIVNLDNALKWGFNWEVGPFEIWDALGVKATVERIQKDGLQVPALVSKLLATGNESFYKTVNGRQHYFDFQKNDYLPVPRRASVYTLKEIKSQKGVVEQNSGASLIDLGDGVLCLEFHTKMNAIDDDIIKMGFRGLELVEQKYQGMVIANEAENFSVGANLMLLWLEAQQKNWEKIEGIVKHFQDFCMALKYSAKPVVAAPFGMTFGGGCEIAMGADAVRAAAETYVGLVEVGVGLIPGGGGCKNMLLNCEATLRAKGQKVWASPGDGGPFPKVQRAFERIAFAKVATSAKEGVDLDYFKRGDKVSLDRSTLLHDAKSDVLELAKNYQRPVPREDILVPGVGGKMAMVSAIRGFLSLGQISEHDALIVETLAHVLCGGDIPAQRLVSEQYLLDLEREAFLKLAATEKSQARMQFMLMNNKPLRN